jgi:large repetitive protein
MAAKYVSRAVLTVIAALALLLVVEGAPAMAAPTLTIGQPIADSSIANPSPVIAGASNDTIDPISLSIYAGASAGGTALQTLVVQPSPVSESWEASVESSLPDGIYTAVAEQTNGASETSVASITFIVDTTAPLPTIESVGSPTNDPTPTLTGSLGVLPGDEQAATVTIYKGGSVGGPVVQEGSATVSGGSWSYSVAQLAEDGTYTAQLTQKDEAGNIGKSAPTTFLLDTVAPAVSLTRPTNGAVLHAARPSFKGNTGTESGDLSSITVNIYSGTLGTGVPAQTLKVPGGGEWETSAALPLADGIYTAVAEQSDAAGNVGRSSPRTFTIETSSPTVSLETSPLRARGSGSVTDATPSFSGTGGSEPEDSNTVTVKLYQGTSVLRTLNAERHGSAWSTGPVAALPDGSYVALAEQQDFNTLEETGFSPLSTFTVDADPPHLTLSAPSDGSSTDGPSEMLSGGAGTAEGDSRTVTAQLFAGTSVGTLTPLASVTVFESGGLWSAGFGGLTPGVYTARAEQRDDVGNVAYTAPVTFTVTSAPSPASSTPTSATTPAPPSASFQWFPSAPTVGEPVSLVSTSTDGGNPITAFAWSLASEGALTPGGGVLTTMFTSSGAHVVRLRVTDGNGLSSEVAETITVAAPLPLLMQPFPVVRLAGSARYSSVKISLFTVQAPVGATVRVSCRGAGCPAAQQTFVLSKKGTAAAATGTALVSLGRFERSLKAGAVLEVRIFKHGEIGKYTRFTVRRGKLPARVDSCLGAAGSKPMPCPSS